MPDGGRLTNRELLEEIRELFAPVSGGVADLTQTMHEVKRIMPQDPPITSTVTSSPGTISVDEPLGRAAPEPVPPSADTPPPTTTGGQPPATPPPSAAPTAGGGPSPRWYTTWWPRKRKLIGVAASLAFAALGALVSYLFQTYYVDTPNVQIEILSVKPLISSSAKVNLLGEADLEILLSAAPTLYREKGETFPGMSFAPQPGAAVGFGPPGTHGFAPVLQAVSQLDLNFTVDELKQLIQIMGRADTTKLDRYYERLESELDQKLKRFDAGESANGVTPAPLQALRAGPSPQVHIPAPTSVPSPIPAAKNEAATHRRPNHCCRCEVTVVMPPQPIQVQLGGVGTGFMDSVSAERLALQTIKESRRLIRENEPKLAKARQRVDTIEADFRKKRLVYEVTLSCTNSGRRAVALRVPAALALKVESEVATTPLLLAGKDFSVQLPTNEAKKVTLVTHEVDAMPDQYSRQVLEARFGSGSVSVHFQDSDGRIRQSGNNYVFADRGNNALYEAIKFQIRR